MNSKTAAVVVTYNRKDLLEKCIDRLRQQKNAACDIIIVDNASTDGTADMIKCQYSVPEVIYMNTGANLGGAGGFQYGVKQAVLLGYEYVWIMDDDTLPQETALYELFEADRELNGKWGFLSSVAYWTDGSICRMNIQKKNIFKHIGEKEYHKKYSFVKMCSFVSLLVKAEVIREVGLPIGEYFIWTDDYEYTG
ncbi:MAG: glycosyltransferase, partial [Lachnospiraceae bacterium]|nr:glycosyltransferase [Lachnospiraceae bacterium]